jgi:hypothetical protein
VFYDNRFDNRIEKRYGNRFVAVYQLLVENLFTLAGLHDRLKNLRKKEILNILSIFMQDGFVLHEDGLYAAIAFPIDSKEKMWWNSTKSLHD